MSYLAMATTTYDIERAAWAARYRREVDRGQVPSVFLPRSLSETHPTTAPYQGESLCSSCGKPLNTNPLPEYYALISMNCHAFCTMCSLFKLAGEDTCIMPRCNEPVPSYTQKHLNDLLRTWSLEQAMEACEDDNYIPLKMLAPLQNIKPEYEKAVAFLRHDTPPKPPISDLALALINMAHLRPRLVGFANLLRNMRCAEGECFNDVTERIFRHVLGAAEYWLQAQSQESSYVNASLLFGLLEANANKLVRITDDCLGRREGIENRDVRLLFDFITEVCMEYYKEKSWLNRPALAFKRVRTGLITFTAATSCF